MHKKVSSAMAFAPEMPTNAKEGPERRGWVVPCVLFVLVGLFGEKQRSDFPEPPVPRTDSEYIKP
jgi:hypothetical protein